MATVRHYVFFNISSLEMVVNLKDICLGSPVIKNKTNRIFQYLSYLQQIL